MPVISVFSASHCHGDDVGLGVARRLGLKILTDADLVSAATERYSIAEDKLSRTLHGPPLVFQRWNREKKRCVAYLRAALAERLETQDILVHGLGGQLIPRNQTHVLRACLVAKAAYRESVAIQTEGVSIKEAAKLIRQQDQVRHEWVEFLLGVGPWSPTLYDVFLPMDSTSVDEAVELLCQSAAKDLFRASAASAQQVADFQLASRVGVCLAENGHDVEVSAVLGEVTVTIDKYVMRLKRMEEELEQLAGGIQGVKSVTMRLGPNFHPPAIYANLDIPQKILLVDDEKDFVRVLSERLESRNLPTSLAFDGEQALSMVAAQVPDVMVLDLRMPGIDGFEVLRRVKREHPDTEVIILTGHGSHKDRELALELGAFAYLEKPADIDILADTMRKAYERVWTKKAAREKSGSGPRST